MSKCSVCPVTESLQFCSRCRLTLYCSSACQTADWKTHKKTCKHIDYQDEEGKTALIHACYAENLEQVQHLIYFVYPHRGLALLYLTDEPEPDPGFLRQLRLGKVPRSPLLFYKGSQYCF